MCVYNIMILSAELNYSNPRNRLSPFPDLMLQRICWRVLYFVLYLPKMYWLVLNNALMVVVCTFRIMLRCFWIKISEVSLCSFKLDLVIIYIFLPVGGNK